MAVNKRSESMFLILIRDSASSCYSIHHPGHRSKVLDPRYSSISTLALSLQRTTGGTSTPILRFSTTKSYHGIGYNDLHGFTVHALKVK